MVNDQFTAEERIRYSISQAVGTIAKEIKANVIVSLTRKETDTFINDEKLSTDIRAVVFRRTDKGAYMDQIYETSLLKKMDSLQPIKEFLREFVANKILQQGDRVICVADDTLGVGFSGLIFILDIDEVFFKVSAHKLTENVDDAAFETIVAVAMELAKEGREGRKIGTAFIIGDENDLKPYCRQMIFNPFQGYPIEQRKVQDPALRETLKEYSLLDGVFTISRDGTVLSGGTYIDIDTADVEIPVGFGTKHRCCAAITKQKDIIAVVLSESGVVRIMKGGKIIARLN